MVCNFWIAFEMHTWRHDPSEYCKRALLLYQGRVHRDWHKTLGTSAAFHLLPLNENRLNELHQELLDNTYMTKIDAVPTVGALPHHFLTARTNDYVFSSLSLHSSPCSPCSPFSPPPFYPPPLPIPALYVGISPPMWILSGTQARHVVTSPPTLPYPTSLNGNGCPCYGMSSPCPHCTWHTTVLSPRPTAIHLSPSDYQPTPAAPGHPNTCATPVSPSAPSPHPPENRLTLCTLRNCGPFGTMHKQTVFRDHYPTTPPSYSPFVPFASGVTDTACRSYNAQPGEPGTTNMTPTVRGSTKPSTSGMAVPPYVASGSETVAATTSTTTCTSVQVVERSPMELAGALEKSNLSTFFPSLIHGLHCSFVIGYPVITCTQFPLNSTSIPVYQKEFEAMVNKEISKNRYIGLLPITTIESLLGPYQSSPLSMIHKPGWPGKFRLVQNFSFPITPSIHFPNPSINDVIDASLFLCTWGKFSTIYLLISCLPSGSQVATRDILKAYQTIPLHPSEWPTTVVHISITHACIDTHHQICRLMLVDYRQI